MIYIAVFNSPYFGGGVEQVVAQLIEHFSSSFRENVTVLCSDPAQADRFEYRGIPCINLKTRRGQLLGQLRLAPQREFSAKLADFVQNNLKSGDVLNVQGVEYLYELGKRGNLPSGVTVVATAHGSLFNQASEYLVKNLPLKLWAVKAFFFFWRAYYYHLERTGLKAADRLITINQTIRDFYQRVYGFKGPIKVIYNGMAGSVTAVKRNTAAPEAFKALMVGSNTLIKGLDVAVRALEQYHRDTANPPIALTIVGFSDFPAKLPRYVGAPYLNYVGRVKPEEVRGFYPQADFLLMPSRFEGFPLVILEALQAGLPVIASKTCKTYELPHYDQFSIVLDTYTIDAWVEALKTLTGNYARYQEGVARADLGAFTWEKAAIAYQEELSHD